jgi:hypothetical protein
MILVPGNVRTENREIQVRSLSLNHELLSEETVIIAPVSVSIGLKCAKLFLSHVMLRQRGHFSEKITKWFACLVILSTS